MKHRMVTAVLVALVQVSQSFPALYHRGWWRLLREGDSCGECDLALCSEPKDCPAGTVLDRCGCCPECGNVEGQICDLDQGNHFYGQCGDDLECRLDADEARFGEVPEPQCVCKSQESICGPEGKTYENICQFNKAYAAKRNITVKHKGPCESAPVISMPPQDAQNYTGNDVIFGCEVSAYPMPHLEWKKKGNDMFLPGDDTHVSVQTHLLHLHLLLAVEVQATALNMRSIMTTLMKMMMKTMNLGTIIMETTLNNNFYTSVVQYLSHCYIY
ncbi:kazal-type serine protease inhibitor domain-containing protein 1-like isoform X2 [Pithys albifrons albifrons]|uniref:kazal-type serine protease inhibitor domain-containing protein 1-like isoform X2 n=1 Tax=Pithys albifrons albifrons TaxID=3385563 RepID=UPI003A5CBC01